MVITQVKPEFCHYIQKNYLKPGLARRLLEVLGSQFLNRFRIRTFPFSLWHEEGIWDYLLKNAGLVTSDSQKKQEKSTTKKSLTSSVSSTSQHKPRILQKTGQLSLPDYFFTLTTLPSYSPIKHKYFQSSVPSSQLLTLLILSPLSFRHSIIVLSATLHPPSSSFQYGVFHKSLLPSKEEFTKCSPIAAKCSDEILSASCSGRSGKCSGSNSFPSPDCSGDWRTADRLDALWAFMNQHLWLDMFSLMLLIFKTTWNSLLSCTFKSCQYSLNGPNK